MNYSEQLAEAETPPPLGLFYWPPFWLYIFLVLAICAIGYVSLHQREWKS